MNCAEITQNCGTSLRRGVFLHIQSVNEAAGEPEAEGPETCGAYTRVTDTYAMSCDLSPAIGVWESGVE